jgi:hypothetical protein
LQKFGIWGFCQNFLQKYCDSLKRDLIFWQGSPMVLGNYRQTRFLRCSSDGPFGYSGDPNNRITEYSVIRVTQITEYSITKYSVIWVTQITEFGDSVFFGFVPIIWKIGKLRSKPNSINPRPCQSVCWSLCR